MLYHTARVIQGSGGEALPVVCNVTDYSLVEVSVEQVLDRDGPADVLMNNAAVQPPSLNSTIRIRRWLLEFTAIVIGALYGCWAVLPTMIAQRRGNTTDLSSMRPLGGGITAWPGERSSSW